MTTPILIYGSTGYARAVTEQLRVIGGRVEVRGYIDDLHAPGQAADGLPVIGFDEWAQRLREVPVLVSIGIPAARRRIAERVAAAGGRFVTLVERIASIASDFEVGEGSFVGHPVYIGPSVRFGRHVQLQPMSTIGHDCTVGDCVTLCVSHIAGNVVIEDDVFVGAGAVIAHGSAQRPLVIGRGATIAAGAVILKSVPAGARMVGNPARDTRLSALRRLRAAAARATQNGS